MYKCINVETGYQVMSFCLTTVTATQTCIVRLFTRSQFKMNSTSISPPLTDLSKLYQQLDNKGIYYKLFYEPNCV